MSPGRVECGPGMFSTAGATASSGVPGARRGDRRDGRDHRARTGLVHLHLFHPVGRLDADAAGVEADALADDREVPVERVALPFPARAQDDHPRRVVAASADGHEHAHAELGGPLRLDDVDPQAVLLGDRPRLVGEDLGADVVGGAVRERRGPCWRPRR